MPSIKEVKAIAIVGPTASGKTSLSIDLAKHFAGEIISADSRQVYKEMDLGTGKVTATEMQGIPHHLIDVANPITDTYTASDFKIAADQALSDISNRGNLPIIAGGTFFYLDILKGNQSTSPVPPNPTLRQELEIKPAEELIKILETIDPIRASQIDTKNPRRLVRAIEIATALGSVPPTNPSDSLYHYLTIGIDIDLETLLPRIKARLYERLDLGMIKEVEKLHEMGLSWEKMESFGLEYRYIARYLQGTITLETMTSEIVTKSRQFAKRQLTWLRRDKSIVWLPFPVDTSLAIKTVDDFLNTAEN